MGIKFDINLKQAMELLALKTGFTEKEFRSNYRTLIMGIHPDTLGNINPIARKVLEDEASRVNLAKEVIESFLKGEYSDYNVNENSSYYKRESSSNNTQEQQENEREHQKEQGRQRQYKEQQRKEREQQEKQEKQAKEREYQEQQRKETEKNEQRSEERNIKKQEQIYKKNRMFISIIVVIIIAYFIIASNQDNANTQVTTESSQVALDNARQTVISSDSTNENQVESIDAEKSIQSENISVAKPPEKKKTTSITTGSTSEDVKRVMGTPSEIDDYIKWWYYDNSIIQFDDNWEVTGWDNDMGKLKVTLGKSQANAPYITIGSSKEVVIKSMGTPSKIDDYIKWWYYDNSIIEFDDNWKVIGWSNDMGKLKVTLGKSQANAPYIAIGSSKEDVIKSMGTPSKIDDYIKWWYYDNSIIEFDDNWKVTGWSNDSGELKVK